MKNLFLHFFLATIIAMLTHLKAGAAVSDDQHWDDQFGPPGVNASPYAILAAVGKNVFVAGSSETAAGGLKANGIARFDGTNWFQLNSGLLANSGIVGIGSD